MLLGASCAERASVPAKVPGARLDEAIVWLTATKTVRPAYPAASVAAGRQGVAVASIVGAADGLMERVDVLEAPDSRVAEAVRNALMQWVFEPLTVEGESERLRIQGKVTFYFLLDDGVPRVLGSPERIAARIRAGQFVPKDPAAIGRAQSPAEVN